MILQLVTLVSQRKNNSFFFCPSICLLGNPFAYLAHMLFSLQEHASIKHQPRPPAKATVASMNDSACLLPFFNSTSLTGETASYHVFALTFC